MISAACVILLAGLRGPYERLCPEIMNSQDNPERIAVQSEILNQWGSSGQWNFTPLSLTLIEMFVKISK